MVRTEISLFMKNAPGELGKFANLLGQAGINIDALTIQDASAYVQQLFKARGKSLKRIASAASYNSMRKDSAEFALIRAIVSDTDKAVDLLSNNDYTFDTYACDCPAAGEHTGGTGKDSHKIRRRGH